MAFSVDQYQIALFLLCFSGPNYPAPYPEFDHSSLDPKVRKFLGKSAESVETREYQKCFNSDERIGPHIVLRWPAAESKEQRKHFWEWREKLEEAVRKKRGRIDSNFQFHIVEDTSNGNIFRMHCGIKFYSERDKTPGELETLGEPKTLGDLLKRDGITQSTPYILIVDKNQHYAWHTKSFDEIHTVVQTAQNWFPRY